MPIPICDGSTAVDAFAIKLVRRLNIHPIIYVAGVGREYVNSPLNVDKGNFMVDYRKGSIRLK